MWMSRVAAGVVVGRCVIASFCSTTRISSWLTEHHDQPWSRYLSQSRRHLTPTSLAARSRRHPTSIFEATLTPATPTSIAATRRPSPRRLPSDYFNSGVIFVNENERIWNNEEILKWTASISKTADQQWLTTDRWWWLVCALCCCCDDERYTLKLNLDKKTKK